MNKKLNPLLSANRNIFIFLLATLFFIICNILIFFYKRDLAYFFNLFFFICFFLYVFILLRAIKTYVEENELLEKSIKQELETFKNLAKQNEKNILEDIHDENNKPDYQLVSETIKAIVNKAVKSISTEIITTLKDKDKDSILINKIHELSTATEEGNNALKSIIHDIAKNVDADMKESQSNIKKISELFSILNDSRSYTEVLKKNSEYLLIIMNTIDDISNKIHVLSINSSITAARAGDVGRPFMVIAKEVRKLSDEAKKSVDKMKDYSEILKKSISVVSELNQTVETKSKGTYEDFNHLLNRIEGFLLSFSIIEARISNGNFDSNGLIEIINSNPLKEICIMIENHIKTIESEVNDELEKII